MTPISTPDPARVAAERLGREEEEGGASAPPSPRSGKKGKRKSPGPWSPERRAAHQAKRAGKSTDTGEKVAPRSPEEVQDSITACSFMAGTVWGIFGPMVKRRALTAEESLRLGTALDPVLHKYLPALSEWGLELNLALCVFALFNATEIKKGSDASNPIGSTVEGTPMDAAPDLGMSISPGSSERIRSTDREIDLDLSSPTPRAY